MVVRDERAQAWKTDVTLKQFQLAGRIHNTFLVRADISDIMEPDGTETIWSFVDEELESRWGSRIAGDDYEMLFQNYDDAVAVEDAYAALLKKNNLFS